MWKALGHIRHLLRIGFVLLRYDALMDMLSLFGEQPRSLVRLRKMRRMGQKNTVQKGDDTDQTHNLAAAFQALGPSFIKIGQAMATRPDIVGPDLAQNLMQLQDRLPPFPGDTAVAIIEQALEAPLHSLFQDFDRTAVAAASIAQVHFATTRNGKAVAVKILRPGIEKAFARDMESFLWLARWLEYFSVRYRRLKPTAVVALLTETIALEMDFRYEAAAAAELRENNADNPAYRLPAVNWALTRRQVLCTDRVAGLAFSEGPAMVKAGYDMKKLAEDLVRSFLTQALKDGFFHADIHQGNLFACGLPAANEGEEQYITAIDFGIMGRLDKKTRGGLADILYGFITQDYDRIARAHFDIGYVPADQSLEKFKQALRAIGAPIAGKAAQDISAGRLLAQLFETTENFNMPTQPQLILLQKTMVTVEGVALDLYPEINMWETSRPIIEQWMRDNLGPAATVRDTITLFRDTARRLPRLLEQLEQRLEHPAPPPYTGRISRFRGLLYGLAGGLIGGLITGLLLIHI